MLSTRLIAGAASGFVLSAVFATAMTVVAFGETFVEPWRVDPARPAPITLRLPRTTFRTLDQSAGAQYPTPATTLGRGEIAPNEHVAAQVRLHERDRRPPRLTRLGAYWLVYFLLVMMFTTYMRVGQSSLGKLLRTQIGMLSIGLLSLIANKGLLLFTNLPPYVVPVALVPLWTSFYLGRRNGVMASSVFALLSGSLIAFDPIATATYFVSCGAGALYIKGRRRPVLLLVAGPLGGMAGVAVYVAATEIFDGFSGYLELAEGMRSGMFTTLMSTSAAGLLAFTFQPLTAAVLGIVSRSQLMNLADLDQPLLRRMARDAPGSWEHSRAMANLAEAAVTAIHGNALLTRVGAYYHDLGKSVQPKYYVENLGGDPSPHDDLDPDVSADAIMAHVIEGVRILREGGIPEPVVEFAYTHHGTGLIEYFWHKCLKEGNPKDLNEDHFKYPGMRPRSRETAVLMLVDAIEAGARTVDPPSREGFETLVQRVIFSKLRQGQLDKSGLSIEEMHIIANQIIDTLCSIYHSRIRYPWQEQEEEERKKKAAARKSAESSDKVATERGSGERSSGERATTTSPEPGRAAGGAR